MEAVVEHPNEYPPNPEALWLHFNKVVRVEDGHQVHYGVCHHCGKEIKRHDFSTTKLWKHLEKAPASGGHGLKREVLVLHRVVARVPPPRAPAQFFAPNPQQAPRAQPGVAIPANTGPSRHDLEFAFLFAIVAGNLPLGAFENEGMQRLFSLAAPTVALPTAKVIKRIMKQARRHVAAGTFVLSFRF